MIPDEIDIFQSICTSKIPFTINPVLWDSFSERVRLIVNNDWKEIKFLDGVDKINPMITSLPDNMGGIYLFIAKPDFIPNTHMYLMYIGRARLTSNQNLRKRCREYINDNRPKVTRMISNWGKYLYIKYLPLDIDNNLIDEVEAELINKILPPFNSMIPDQKIQKAVNAFNM